MTDVRKKVAMVFQLGALFDSMTVYENISYPLDEHTQKPAKKSIGACAKLLSMVSSRMTLSKLFPADCRAG